MGVRRGPSRAVSLGDVRDLPVQTMGLADVGWPSKAAKPGEWSSDAATWKEFLDQPGQSTRGQFDEATGRPYEGVGGTQHLQAGKLDVVVTLDPPDSADDIEMMNLSPKGSVTVEFDVGEGARADEMTPGETRESLRLVGEIVKSLQAEGYNIWAVPETGVHARLYERFGMEEAAAYPESVVMPGRHEPDEIDEHLSQGLSDDEIRQLTRPGGFTPSPPMSGSFPGAPLQPPRLPNVEGFDVAPPMSGTFPGAPITGPQKPTILSMAGGGQESLPGMSPEEIQAEINRRGIAEGREILGPPRTPEEQVAYERELKRRNSPPRPVVEPPPLPPASEARRESSPLGWLGGRAAEWEGRQTYEPGPSKRAYPGAPLTQREPVGDPQSQMSQTMLADMFAQQAAQPQQGYFGGLGEAVGGMSTEQKIALLVGLGLLTGGTSTPLMAPALGVGAGLALTQ